MFSLYPILLSSFSCMHLFALEYSIAQSSEVPAIAKMRTGRYDNCMLHTIALSVMYGRLPISLKWCHKKMPRT